MKRERQPHDPEKATFWRRRKHERIVEEAKVLELRSKGKTLYEIQGETGLTAQQVRLRLQRGYERLVSKETVAEAVRLELVRLDKLQVAVSELAYGGNLDAVDRCLRISAARCKLLGLYSPERHQVDATVTTHDPSEYVRRILANPVARLKACELCEALADEHKALPAPAAELTSPVPPPVPQFTPPANSEQELALENKIAELERAASKLPSPQYGAAGPATGGGLDKAADSFQHARNGTPRTR
jgi:hypothetical protein